ncbi:hypothetical protein L198_02572 [Cryptococcus wingfieldii CBS 7118]|uniref:Uncharacterized protein n=1 Tax=Cryptococcus wingfieldii CBS 7118 TaxID=1295528 RepID=A0A1E3JLV6_9TREE|nr:hypothetical protein L198_02572 [Cryptococcus wingfieldii CBS 7118]ODO01845.1 hypothetical protein L198_02572 [Cryptococcus wingfieldii CBS 7118]
MPTSQADEPTFLLIDGIKVYELRAFDGWGYHRWARAMKLYLLTKGLLSILDGDEIFVDPVTSADWVKRDREVYAHLRNAVIFWLEGEFSFDVIEYTEPSAKDPKSRAKEYWDHLKKEVDERFQFEQWKSRRQRYQ